MPTMNLNYQCIDCGQTCPRGEARNVKQVGA